MFVCEGEEVCDVPGCKEAALPGVLQDLVGEVALVDLQDRQPGRALAKAANGPFAGRMAENFSNRETQWPARSRVQALFL